MKYILSLFIIIVCNSASHAQIRTDYTFGKTMDYKNYKVDLLETTPDLEHYLVVSSTHKAFKFNFKRHVLNKQLQIINTIDQNNIDIHHLFNLKSGIYAIYSDRSKKRDAKRKRWIAKIDPTTFEFKEERILFEITSHKGPFYPSLFYKVSPDKKKIMVLHKPLKQEKNKYKYHLYIYDDDFSILSDKEFQLTETKMDFSLKNTTIDNDGNVYLIGKKTAQKKYSADGKKFEGITIKKITQSNNILSYDLKLSNRKKFAVRDFKLVPANNGFNLYMLESEFLTTSNKLKNIVCVSLDHNLNEVHRIQHNPNAIDFLNTTDKLKYDNLEIKEVTLLDNGHKLLICEKQNEVINQSRVVALYETGDFYALKLNQRNEVIWASFIAKKQQSIYPINPIGSEIFVKNDLVYFLFNEHEKNLDPTQKKTKAFKGARHKGVLKIVQLNLNTGKIADAMVYNLNQEGIYGDLKNTLKLNDGILFLGKNQKDNIQVDYTANPVFVKVKID